MTKREFDERVRRASVAIVEPVIRSWQIQYAGQPDVFVGKLLGELLTQMVANRIMILEALDRGGFFDPEGSEESPESDGSPAPWEPPQIIN